MTDNEIIKALECHRKGLKYCKECPLQEPSLNVIHCNAKLLDGVLDLINRQQAKIERLERVKETDNEIIASLEAEIDRQQAEIEELKEFSTARFDKFATEYDWNIKAEAIKEFAARLKEKFLKLECEIKTHKKTMTLEDVKQHSKWLLHDVTTYAIDTVAKEMAGDGNA